MITKISNMFYRVSKGWVAFCGLIIFILFTILVLPKQTTEANKSNADLGTPDLSIFYTPDELYRMAEAYGEAGRQAFIQVRLTFDVVWPLIYLLFLSTSISWLLLNSLPPDSRFLRVNLLPLLATLLDYLENFSNILIMSRYPMHTIIIEWLAPIFTLLKWMMVGASFVVLFLGIGLLAKKYIHRR